MIMDINNFLVRKKRELGSNSTDGDERKRPRKASSFDGEVFEEALNSDNCVAILCNCVTNLEEKINKLFQITYCVKDSQIRGELHLKYLTKTINIICTIFYEYEKERKEREQIVKNLEEIYQ